MLKRKSAHSVLSRLRSSSPVGARAHPMHALFLALSISTPPCEQHHVSCPSTFGLNNTGCCALDDPTAVCCQTPLIGQGDAMSRSYCCPHGSECSESGCTPLAQPLGYCGPEQGVNCNVSYLCSSGPADWSASAKPAVLVIGDSVSIGWTPVLAANLSATHTVIHSPGRMADGGARSTSNFVNCADYLLQTDTLQPLPLRRGDTVLMNFGLHDYNLGLGGVPEYTTEYRIGLAKALALTQAAGAALVMLATTPAHNTASAADDTTVVALNVAAAGLSKEFSVDFVDLHTPLIAACGPVPWADNGTSACPLCAPKCKALSVHYTAAGYEVIQGLIYDAIFNVNRQGTECDAC